MKEVSKETTYRCDNCKEEMGVIGSWDHGYVKVDTIHTIWGSQGTLHIHFCEDCTPNPETLKTTEEEHHDHWDTVVEAVFNSHFDVLDQRITTAKVISTIPYGGGGESRTEEPSKYSKGVQDYIQMVQESCIERYDFDQDGPTKSSW